MAQIDKGIKTYVEGKRDPGGMLLPCPFCGGEMTVSGSSRLRRFTISHKNLRNCYFYSFEIDWQTVGSLAEAIEAWNNRAGEQNG